MTVCPVGNDGASVASGGCPAPHPAYRRQMRMVEVRHAGLDDCPVNSGQSYRSVAAGLSLRSGSWVCMDAFVSVYVDMAPTADPVPAAHVGMPKAQRGFDAAAV